MDLQEIVSASSASELCHSFHERHAFDITHGTTQLDNAYIRLLIRVIDRYPCNSLDPVLNRICDVRHDLDCFAQVCSFSLLLNHMLVYLARGDVVVASESDVQVALVVTEIEVDLAAVGENENFAMPVECSINVLWAF